MLSPPVDRPASLLPPEPVTWQTRRGTGKGQEAAYTNLDQGVVARLAGGVRAPAGQDISGYVAEHCSISHGSHSKLGCTEARGGSPYVESTVNKLPAFLAKAIS